jgi:hypothetical protein
VVRSALEQLRGLVAGKLAAAADADADSVVTAMLERLKLAGDGVSEDDAVCKSTCAAVRDSHAQSLGTLHATLTSMSSLVAAASASAK